MPYADHNPNEGFFEDAGHVFGTHNENWRAAFCDVLRSTWGQGLARRRVYAKIIPFIKEFAPERMPSNGIPGNEILTDFLRDIKHNNLMWPITPLLAWLCCHHPDKASKFYLDCGLSEKLKRDFRRYLSEPIGANLQSNPVETQRGVADTNHRNFTMDSEARVDEFNFDDEDFQISLDETDLTIYQSSPNFDVDNHSYDEGYREALWRIDREREAKSGTLDLGRLKISEIPHEVIQLNWLRNFDAFKSKIRSFSYLSEMYNLEKIFASGSQIMNLLALRSCVNLRYLNLENCPIVKLDGIQGCTRLQYLDIDGTDVYDLKPLKRLKNLRVLLINCRADSLEDVPPLPKLKRMNWKYRDILGPYRV
jgi:hypothetical protein